MTRMWRRLGPLCDCLQNQTSLLSQSDITTIVYEPLPAHGHYGKYKSNLIPGGLPHFGLLARWCGIYVPLNSVQGVVCLTLTLYYFGTRLNEAR
jgi:hypothetical protein